ncbi:hypothetical protein [Tepidiforma sp.]|uniref:hypothetical protein n=1 Tax=Tepidiforma sp. TaxID=2682230 RepID=UPI002ADD8958|nr:hypothetical protein [Tepidiforma sp.]
MDQGELVSFSEVWGISSATRSIATRNGALSCRSRCGGVWAECWPTPPGVFERQEQLEGKGLADTDAQLRGASGYAVYKTSRYDFEKLPTDATNLAANLRKLIAGFSPNMRQMLEKFDFEPPLASRARRGCSSG